MEVDPDNWTGEMDEERVTYKLLEYAHDSARELYEYHVKALEESFHLRNCWPCIEQGFDCDGEEPCRQYICDENGHVCEYPQTNPNKPIPLYRLSKEDHQDLYDLAREWLEAANAYLLSRIRFQARYPGAWHVSEGPHDHRTTPEGHLTKLNMIKQEVCAITGRVLDHLTWRDKELYESRGEVDFPSAVNPKIKYNTSTSLSRIAYPGQHQFPDVMEPNLRKKVNISDPLPDQRMPPKLPTYPNVYLIDY
jgi:hypothetical protein